MARAALFFLALTLLFYAPCWLAGLHYLPADFLLKTPLWYTPEVRLHNFDLYDAIVANYPLDEFLNASLKQGRLPLWSPYNFGGHPVLANGYGGWLYPPRLLLHWLFSPLTAHTLLLMLHTFLAGFGTWLLGRRLGQSTGAATLAGITWMFSGFVMGWFELEFAPLCAGLLPLLCLALDYARFSWRAAVAVALLVDGLTCSGMLQTAMYSLLTGAGFLVLRAGRHPGQWLRPALGTASGFLLAAPMLLPFLDLLKESQRPVLAMTFHNHSFRYFLATLLPTLIAPDALGTPIQDFAITRIPGAGNFIHSELLAYVGIVPLLLAALGATGRGPARVLAIVAGLILLIPATPAYHLIYHLPGFSQVNATRIIFVLDFVLALLAGFGYDRLDERLARRLSLFALALLLVWAGSVALVQHFELPLLKQLAWHRLIRLPDREMFLSDQEFGQAVRDNFHKLYRWESPAVFLPLVWLAGTALALRVPRRRMALLIALAAADLMVYGMRFNTLVPGPWVYPENPSTRFLRQHSGLDRVLGVGSIKPSSLMPLRVADVGGYSSVYPRRAAEYMAWLMRGEASRQAATLPAQAFPITNYASGLVDLMGVKICVGYPDRPLSGLELVAQTPMAMYLNPRRLPRVFLAPYHRVEADRWQILRQLESRRVDPRQTVLLEQPPEPAPEAPLSPDDRAQIRDYQPDRVTLEARTQKGAWLVLSDTYTPDWVARLDGVSARVYLADFMFRALRLPPGQHVVVFEYQPPGWRLGWLLWAGTVGGWLLGFLVYAVFTRIRRG